MEGLESGEGICGKNIKVVEFPRQEGGPVPLGSGPGGRPSKEGGRDCGCRRLACSLLRQASWSLAAWGPGKWCNELRGLQHPS